MNDEAETASAEQETFEEVTEHDPAIVAEARELGWKPADEWTGEVPEGFIDDPKAWVDKAYQNPVIRKLHGEVGSLRKESDEKIRRIEAALSAQTERQKAAYEARIQQLSEAKARAKEDGDYETYISLDEQEDQLKAQAPKDAPKEDEGGISGDDKAVIDRWAAGKEWLKDSVKNAAAGALWADAKARGLTDIQAILSHVDQGMEQRFVDMRKEHPRPTQARLGEGLALGGSSDPTSFSKLPSAAKQSFDRFWKQGHYGDPKTADRKAAEKQYAEDYHNG